MAAMQFHGEEHFRATPEQTFALLTDLDAFAASIPDLVSADRIDAQTLACVVRPGFSFLRGTLKLRVALGELQPPSAATLRIEAQGIGLTMKVESRMTLVPEPDGVKLLWNAEVGEMKGLVATISPGLVRSAAEKVIRDGWRQMHAKLDGA